MRIATAATVCCALILAVGAEPVLAQTKARLISGSQPALPKAASDIGAQGIVKISGVIGVDGKVRDAKIAKSTGSDVLDQTALDAVAALVFEPARDKDGAATEQPFTTTISMLKDSIFSGGKLTIATKTCVDFVLDADWFTRTHPDEPLSEMPLYNAMVGMFVLPKSSSSAEEMLKAVRQMETAWPAVYKECSAHPDRLFFELLKKRMR